MKAYDVVIVGAGIVGLSMFNKLVNRGLKVAIIERHRTCMGATGYSGGICRLFHMDKSLINLAVESMNEYKALVEREDTDFKFHKTGFVYFPKHQEIDVAMKLVGEIDSKYEVKLIKCKELNHIMPVTSEHLNDDCIYEPQSGFINPPEICRHLLMDGIKKGGVILEGVNADRVLTSGGNATGVQTNIGPIHASTVVLASGVQTPDLLDQLGVRHDLYPRNIQVDLQSLPDRYSNHPAFIDDVYDLNGRPNLGATILLGHPTYDTRYVDEHVSIKGNHSTLINEIGRRRFRWVEDSEGRGGYSAFECYSNNPLGMTGEVEDFNNLYVATGYSGGGFKIAPAISELLANQILNT